MEVKENAMGTRKMMPLLLSMAIPPMASMLIQSMYNIVDSFFVAKMGQDALTAVSLAFPLQNIVLSLAVGLGIGLNSYISRSLGAKDNDSVSTAVSHGFLFTGIHSIILIFVGVFLSKPFIGAFTHDAAIIKMGTDYLSVVISLSFGMQFHICIEKIFQSTGNMFVPMCLQGVGALVNIVLDPIMIFGMLGFPAMGVKGAAVATVIGQMVACAGALLMMIIKKPVKTDFRHFKFSVGITGKIYGVAAPSALMMAMPSLLVSVLNSILASFSQTAVAVFGLYFKLQTFIYMPASGLIQGVRPIVGYNYGAGKYHRLKQCMKCAVCVTGVIMVLGTLAALFAPKVILTAFNSDSEMFSIGVPMLRIICVGFIPSAVSCVLAGCFEALGRGGRSLCVSLLRQLVIIAPLAFILSKSMGVTGVWLSFPVAEVTACIVSIVLMNSLHLFKKGAPQSTNL